MRVKKAGLLTSKSFYLPCLPAFQQWLLKAFVIRYSGATVRDLHPFPYSLLAIARSTFSLNHYMMLMMSKIQQGERYSLFGDLSRLLE